MHALDRRIGLIKKLIATFLKCHAEGVEIDQEKLIQVMGYEHGVARRTALEYIAAAREGFHARLADLDRESAEAARILKEAQHAE